MAVLLAGAAAIALLAPPANAQQAAQPAADQTDEAKTEEPKPAEAGATLLDKILVISRTGETAIESLASASHVDREQLDRRMATTPNEMLLGVPGVAVQADARRVSSSINIRGLQDFGRVAVIVDGARQNFSAPTTARNRPSMSIPSSSSPSTSSAARSPTPMVPAPSAASSSSTPRTPRTSSSLRKPGPAPSPDATKATARAGPPAPAALTA
ncbi:hypothetical protein AJ88_18810 [Mesorhizobium amorphae CCBAU 01583]|nr:hypothetical protein AJ88_18810 [Mesorhizobium amorphae CCBAU 01583]